MGSNEIKTETRILEAAEKEFLAKGYDRATIFNIAKIANVNHAMIHYYFDTKEKLFSIIFKNKIELLAQELTNSLRQEGCFTNRLENTIEQHFKFVLENPGLTLFLLREIATDSEQIEQVHNLIKPQIEELMLVLNNIIDDEVAKGTIRAISANDLFLNIVSLNASSIVIATLLNKQTKKGNEEEVIEFLLRRKQKIKEFILQSIEI